MRTNEFIGEMTPPARERKTKTAEEALQALMRLCSRAEKSTGDARRLMRSWGVPEMAQQAIIDRLVAQRFIDNRRYAEAYTREKSNLAGWGARKIALQLRQKEIERDIIAEVLATLDATSQNEKLAEKLRRKLHSTKAANHYELRGKLLRYALGLGYDYEQTLGVLDKIVSEDL